MDWTGCSEVEQIPGKVGGVPILKDTGVQADAITDHFAAARTAAEIADMFRLKLEQVTTSIVRATLSCPFGYFQMALVLKTRHSGRFSTKSAGGCSHL